MKKYILLLLFAITSINGYSQTTSSYSKLKLSGKIPKDFTVPSHLKYKADIQKIAKEEKNNVKNDTREFYLQNNFVIDDLLQSGKVLFNDPLTDYVTKVGNHLLEQEPSAIRNKIRFYVVRTPEVNAFATNNGIILVNVGLLAQLENEAQLAFILAHEISHFKEKHPLELFLKRKSIEQNSEKSVFKHATFEDDIVIKENQYSKEIETEADEHGLEAFLKSKYSSAAIEGVFDVLKYANLPFDDVFFDKSFFEMDYLLFPDKLHLDTITLIGTTEINTDEETKAEISKWSTHPSTESRHEKMHKNIKDHNNDGKQTYVISETDFIKNRQTARYEMVNYFIRDFNYYQAIYTAYLLLKEKGTNDSYLQKSIAQALYSITKFRNADLENDIEWNHEDIEGESQRLYYFLNEMKNAEINVLALKYAWKAHKNDPDDTYLKGIAYDLIKELVYYHVDEINDFHKNPPPPKTSIQEAKTSVDTNKIVTNKKQSKYDKIRNRKKTKKQKATFEYAKYAFVDELKDDAFTKQFAKAKKSKKQWKIEQEGYGNFSIWDQYRLYKKLQTKGYALGQKRAVIVNPFYLKKNYTKVEDKQVELVMSEKGESLFRDFIKKNAQLNGVNIDILDAGTLKQDQVEEFNDLVLLNEWFSQWLSFSDVEDMIVFNQDQIDALTKKYKTDYFIWMGVISAHKGKPTNFVCIIVNLKAAEIEMIKLNKVRMGDRRDVMNLHIYDIFFQLSKSKK